jgi:uncharacterized membrane protein YraQ (UPF0718 family)
MMGSALIGFYSLLFILLVYTYLRKDGSLKKGLNRAAEQIIKLVPRMLCALIAAGFIAQLMPSELIASFLGAESGAKGIVIAAMTGMLIPAGPVVVFTLAAIFAHAGASVQSLIVFITSWSIFAGHRIIIFELPLLGKSFLKLRLLSAGLTPILAGIFALGLQLIFAKS